METLRRIDYDRSAAGGKVLPLPAEMPFAPFLDELAGYSPGEEHEQALEKLISRGNPYDTAGRLSSRLLIAENPHIDLLRILSMASSGEPAGMILLYSSLLAVPPNVVLAGELGGFRNTKRVMERIEATTGAGEESVESDEWFSRKVMLLSMSRPLPGDDSSDPERAWLSWSDGVRRALADPDDRWDEAVNERLKTEIEASDLRIRRILASLDPDRHSATAAYLQSLSEENRWMAGAAGDSDREDEPLILRRGLENIWDSVISSLEESGPGGLLARMFEMQSASARSLPVLRTGAAVIRALSMHPELARGRNGPDLPSCLYLFLEHASRSGVEIMLPHGKRFEALEDHPGFDLDDGILGVDLSRIPRRAFSDDEGVPREMNWAEMTLDKGLSYKSLVLAYIDNDSFLMEIINNPKSASKPGVISLISQRCRSLRVLSVIANRRDLYTGFQNKDVPLNLLRNPAKIPVTALRKFIHVRYVDRMTLQNLAGRSGSQIREEVRREIQRFVRMSH